jgi:hypothetical protein
MDFFADAADLQFVERLHRAQHPGTRCCEAGEVVMADQRCITQTALVLSNRQAPVARALIMTPGVRIITPAA